MRGVRPLAERFWEKVDKNGSNGCYQWLGAIRAHRYGHIFTGTSPEGKTLTELAHRVAWMMAGNALPEWPMVIDHICKNMGCVNIAHLRVVSQSVNSTENSVSPFAINRRKTHCKYGHPLSGNNIRVSRGVGPHGTPTTTRLCLACYGPGGARKKIHNAKNNAKRKARRIAELGASI